MPNWEERQEIFKIHLSKRRREIDRFDLEELAAISDGFSGAEIEQALIAAMYDAFAQDREFAQLDIIAAIQATLPLSRTMMEQVTALRDWAQQRARPAAASDTEASDTEASDTEASDTEASDTNAPVSDQEYWQMES